MAELFEGRSVPLSAAGGAATALANAGGLKPFADGLSEFIQAQQKAKLLDTRLADLGIDDRQAVALGAPRPQTVVWGDNGKTLTTNPSAITVRDLMRRKQLGAEPTLRDVLAPGAQLHQDVDVYADAPVSVAEKLGPFIRGAAKPAGGANDLTDAERVALFKGMEQGLVSPAQLTSRGNKTKLLAQKLMEDPNYNAAKADINFFGSRSESTAAGQVRGGRGSQVAATAGTLEDTFAAIEPLITKLSPTSLRVADSAFRRGISAVDDKNANQLLALLNEAAYLQAQILKGGTGSPTDQDVKKMRENFAKGLGTGGFQGLRAASEAVNQSRVRRLTGKELETGGSPTFPVITTQAQYNALPKGSRYQDSNGKVGVKK